MTDMHWIIEIIVKYWLQWALGLLASLLGLVYRRVLAIKKQSDERCKQEKEENDAMKIAVVAIMRDRIRQSCRYHLKNEYIPADDLDVLNQLNDAYHSLGGNSTTTELVSRTRQLPIYVEKIH